jgi:hypothetical protein
MKARQLGVMVLALAVLAIQSASAVVAPVTPQRINASIRELDVEGAARLLALAPRTPPFAVQRALLALYQADCQAAHAELLSPALKKDTSLQFLASLADSCSGATAASLIVEDEAQGVWLRLQDDEDRALVPYIVDVAVRARRVIEKDLHTDLPRPLRIDLVRDLFSLSAVSGLALEHAETTGTVAVARWGRITMVSPRAAKLGYPWQDTLAHEIAHLALSRATRDVAPLWLQEGIAKREERRWREPLPFDDGPSAHAVARHAIQRGRDVGIDGLGRSIAMLPTPEQASTAFAEVASFVDHLLSVAGEPALHLLMLDLKGLGTDQGDSALISVTGYDLPGLITRWKSHLLAMPVSGAGGVPEPREAPGDVNFHVRLGDLLRERGHAVAALEHFDKALARLPSEPNVRVRAARAAWEAGEPVRPRHGQVDDVDGAHGQWLSFEGRLAREAGAEAEASRWFAHGVALDPLAEEVACEGHWRRGNTPWGAQPLPSEARQRALCEAAQRRTAGERENSR